MSLRAALTTAAVLCLAPFAGLAAQQGIDAAAPTASAPAATATTTTPEPRNSALFSRKESSVTPSTASDRAAMPVAGDSHTIVVSTLVLVLAIVILVLLIA